MRKTYDDYMRDAMTVVRSTSARDIPSPERDLWLKVIATQMCDMAGRVMGDRHSVAKRTRHGFLWLFEEDFVLVAENAECEPSKLLLAIVNWVRNNAKERN